VLKKQPLRKPMTSEGKAAKKGAGKTEIDPVQGAITADQFLNTEFDYPDELSN
jgi:hypothetical protein